jgi:hypothetical protein
MLIYQGWTNSDIIWPDLINLGTRGIESVTVIVELAINLFLLSSH